MIEDLEWRRDSNGKWILHAYDGHVWFPIPFTNKISLLNVNKESPDGK